MFPVMLSTCWFHFTYILVTDREFLGRRYEYRVTRIASWVGAGGSGCWHCWMDIILDRRFFHKNYTLKQKRLAACVWVRWAWNNIVKGRGQQGSGTGQGEGKMRDRLIRNFYQRVMFMCERVVFSIIILQIHTHVHVYVLTHTHTFHWSISL
jgi:hypothetical protein